MPSIGCNSIIKKFTKNRHYHYYKFNKLFKYTFLMLDKVNEHKKKKRTLELSLIQGENS